VVAYAGQKESETRIDMVVEQFYLRVTYQEDIDER